MHKLRIAFVIDRVGVVDVLSIPQVAGYVLQRGHEAVLIEYGRKPDRALRDLEAFAPDIIAYSVCSNEIDRYLAINRDLKSQLRFFALFGGPHPTFTPSLIEEEGVDAICRGEADLVFPQFLDRFGTDAMYEVSNFAFHVPGGKVRENTLADLVPDLDAFPFPARELLFNKSRFMARNPIKAFMAGRGCPFGCAYCFNNAYNQLYSGKGRILRIKSVNYLLKEIRDVRERYPLTFVRFHDDVFGYDSDWLAEFAERFPVEISLRFSCYMHPRMATEKAVKLLKKAGCHAVCMAVECGNERIRNEVLKRSVSNDEIVASAQRLKRAGLQLLTFNMIGIPGETKKDIFDTIRLNRQIGTDFADVSIFYPFPGTQAHAYCLDHKFLDAENCEFENAYSRSYLNLDPAFKRHIFLWHKLFLSLIEHPGLENLVCKLPEWRMIDDLLHLHYRFQYGRLLHKHIYASSIPFTAQLLGAADVLFSQNRI
ncbi:MAG: radical SAM protein [Smithella sp.]